MTSAEFKERTKRLGLESIRLVESLPQRQASAVIGNQLLRCATSVGANYRAACRARSRADMVAKLGIVLEEADETGYWLELLVEAGTVPVRRVESLIREAGEIAAMTVASIKTLRSRPQA